MKYPITDKHFLAWIRTLDTCLPRWKDDDSRIEAAHVRRANNSGVGVKPEFSALPLTKDQHAYQHQHGETALVNKALGANMSREEAHAYMDELVRQYNHMFLRGRK